MEFNNAMALNLLKKLPCALPIFWTRLLGANRDSAAPGIERIVGILKLTR